MILQECRKIISLIILASTPAFAVVECEHPLHQKIHRTIPTFVRGYDDSQTMKMFRGVKGPQFTQSSLLHFLFHDPFVYSSGQMIELGQGASLSSGSWKYTPPEKSSVDNVQAFSSRWDEMLIATNSNAQSKDGEHPVWNQSTYGNYNGGNLYHWVQFASTLLTTATGYGSGGSVLNMQIPTARVNPQKRDGDEAFVIPVLIAPWEVVSATLKDNSDTTLQKVFENSGEETGKENRCLVSYLEIKNSINKNVGYLSLCSDIENCDNDQESLSAAFGSEMKTAVNDFIMEGEKIRFSKTIPTVFKGGLCSEKNKFTTVQDLQTMLSVLSTEAQYSRLKKQLGAINRLVEIKCHSDLKRNIALWKQIPQQPWKHRLILGLGTQDGVSVSQAIRQCITEENALITCSDLLEKFAIKDTTLTRKEFIRDLLSLMARAPASDQSSTASAYLKNYLARIK